MLAAEEAIAKLTLFEQRLFTALQDTDQFDEVEFDLRTNFCYASWCLKIFIISSYRIRYLSMKLAASLVANSGNYKSHKRVPFTRELP